MSQVTDPVMLDTTGQDIVAKLQDVIDAINGGTIDPLTVTQNGTYTPGGTTLGYGPVTVSVGVNIDFSAYGTLFKYCLLSTDSTDQFNRNDRWFKRNSSEPIIVLGSAFFTSGSMVYTGYAVISFTGTAVTGTYSSYGDLNTPMSAITPAGTTFYIQQMNGMYPPSTASNKLKLQFGNNTQNVLEFVIDDTKLIHNAGTDTLGGDSDLLQAFYKFIDSVYQMYYVGS